MSTALPQPDAASPVPILLVAEQERLHATLRPLIQQALPGARLTWVNQVSQAPARAQTLTPSIILIDDDLLHDDPIRLIRQLAHDHPQVAVLALVDEANLVEARQSLTAGARAVVHKPVQLTQLQAKFAQLDITLPTAQPAPTTQEAPPVPTAADAAPATDGAATLPDTTVAPASTLDDIVDDAIDDIVAESADDSQDAAPDTAPVATGEEATARQSHRLIVFAAAKGGVGCTTLAVNSAVALHELTGQSVVLVDAHFDAPALEPALNLLAGPTWRDALETLDRHALDQDADDADDGLPSDLPAAHATGIHVLPAPAPQADLLQPTPAQITRLVTSLRRRFDWVLVDLGTPYPHPAATWLDLADRVLLVVTPELTGLHNARALLGTMTRRALDLSKVWLVLNRAGMPGGLRRTDIEERLQLRVRHAVPEDGAPVGHSLNRGVPLVVSHPQGAITRSLVELAQLLGADPADKALSRPRRGPARRWLARLWGA